MQDEFAIECLCGASNFERVIVQRGANPPLVTDFVACLSCRVMYDLPPRNEGVRLKLEVGHAALAYRKPGHRPREASAELRERRMPADQARSRTTRGDAMSDDPKKTVLDRKLIALTEEHEVRSWCQSLGCTEAQLRKAVAAIGHSADKVRDYMKVHKP